MKSPCAVAVAMAWGAQAGLHLLLRLDGQADGYYPYHAARADLLRRTHQRRPAADAYKRALARCGNRLERAYLQRRLDELLDLVAQFQYGKCHPRRVAGASWPDR